MTNNRKQDQSNDHSAVDTANHLWCGRSSWWRGHLRKDAGLLRVVTRAQEVERDVRLVTHHPAVVRLRRNVEDRARRKLPHFSILERNRRAAGDDHAEVFDVAPFRTNARPDISRPLPARLIGRATDGHAANVDELEAAARELAHFVRILEALENHFDWHRWRGHP